MIAKRIHCLARCARATARRASLPVWVALVWAVILAGPANAITIRVPQDYAKIQSAIDAAQNDDEIIVSSGTYVENINYGGKNVVLRSVNPTDSATVAATIIDGNKKGRAVTFAGTETSSCVLSGFTIRNGKGGIYGNSAKARIERNTISGNSAINVGGGLYRCNGTIQNNVISGNWAGGSLSRYGGGLYQCNGTIQNNTITSNSVSGGYYNSFSYGGGLYQCNGTIQNNAISGNSASGSGYGYGGGLYQCNGTLQNNVISGNSARGSSGDYGGGLYQCNGTIQNNVISGNWAGGSSGHSGGGGLSDCAGMIQDNVISGNTASAGGGSSYGGGLYQCNGTIQNNTITNNSASAADRGGSTNEHGESYGGGLYGCSSTVRNNTISGNSARTEGGGLCHCSGMIENNVISGNSVSAVYGGDSQGGGLSGCDGTIQNNVIAGNSANGNEYYASTSVGGGLYGCGGTIQNNTISGNSVSAVYGGGSRGGGLYGCNSTIRNNVITSNSASGNPAWTEGGGLWGCTGVIVNCIIWGNTAAVYSQISYHSIPSYSCIQGYTVGQWPGNIGLNPRFVGPSDFHLLPDSPCIDGGTNANCPATDKDGNRRPLDGDGDGLAVCDMGAYEYILPRPGIPVDAGEFTSSTRVTFTWTAAPDGSTSASHVVSYDLQVGILRGIHDPSHDIYEGNVGNVLTKTVTGSNGQTLYARVRARYLAGSFSAWSLDSDGITIDTIPPRLTRVIARDHASVEATFDEPVANADKPSNYTCTGNLRILGALQLAGAQFYLYTTDQTPETSYTLRVKSAVKDRAGNGIDASYCSRAFVGSAKTAVAFWELYR